MLLKPSQMEMLFVYVCSKDLAKQLGYTNYAEMSLSTKMAGTVENVLSMIDR